MVSHRKAAWLGVFFLVCALSLAVFASSAAAQDDDVAALRSQLDQLASGVTAEAGQEEYEMAVAWLDEAEELQASDSGAAEARLRRVDHMITLLRVVLETNDMRTGIARQKEGLERSRQQIADLQEDIESLEAQKADRQRELERIESGQ